MKNTMIVFLILIAVPILVAEKTGNNGETQLTKSVPDLIDYQGRITDGSNDPITTPVSIAFAIYDNSVDGTELWSETHTSVTPVDGLVHLLLGSESAFASDLFDGSERWLGIKVGSDDEMTPRLQIVSSPYAITANTVKGNSLFVDDSGSVGIGTTTPNTNTRLHVNEGTILFDGTSGSTPASGAGTRFMWIPSKYAIRAGSINGTQWDDANIGLYSAAFGLNNTGSGPYSFAAGSGNSVTGVASSAIGLSNTVTRPYSYAFGNNSSATGSYSFAFGRYAEAQAFHEIALGRFNVVSGTWGTWIDSEPLFILGNGADDLNRSNALTVFKDGRTTIGSDVRGEMLTVEGTVESKSGGFKFPDGTTQTTAATEGGDITAVTAGTGLTGGGESGDIVLYHEDTSSQFSISNPNGTVLEDIVFDSFGHVTGATSYNLDARYFTETEINANYVNKSDLDHLDAADGSPTNAVYVDNEGRVGINDNTPSYQLDVDGSMNINNSGIYFNNQLGIYSRTTSICVGIAAGENYQNTGTGIGNSFFGTGSGHDITTGANNTFAGQYTGMTITEGSYNSVFGESSGMNLTTGTQNTLIGAHAGNNISSTNYNTILGYNAGYNNNGSGNVFIGFSAGQYTSGVSNTLFIENSNSNLPLIYGDFTDGSEIVKIYGDFETSGTATINDVLHLTPMDTAPTSPSNGDIYVGTDNHIYCYLGGAWKQLDN